MKLEPINTRHACIELHQYICGILLNLLGIETLKVYDQALTMVAKKSSFCLGRPKDSHSLNVLHLSNVYRKFLFSKFGKPKNIYSCA